MKIKMTEVELENCKQKERIAKLLGVLLYFYAMHTYFLT